MAGRGSVASPGSSASTLGPSRGLALGTALAPVQWCLTRLDPPLDDGPYYACRLRDGSTQCDCAEWTYQIAGNGDRTLCKHLAALAALGWI